MKKFIKTLLVFASVFTVAQAQLTEVTKWGFLGGGRIGNWKFAPSATAGNAGIVTTAASTTEWATLRGEFASPITATTAAGNALVVTGKVSFTGSGFDTWSGLRYGLWQHDAAGTVHFGATDSARWGDSLYVGTDTARFQFGDEANSRGYLLTPASSAQRPTDGVSGGVGTQWIRTSGNWISTGNGSGPIYLAGLSLHKPARATASAGSYEFAISVQPLGDGTKEVRFYLIKGTAANSENSTYYFAGSFIDTTSQAATFNGIVFAPHLTGSGPNPDLRQVNYSEVKAGLGNPLTIPTAPWSDYYVDQWGFFGWRGDGVGGHRNVIGNWRFVPDPNNVIGNAGIATDAASTIEWAVIRGGFVEPVTATTAKALTVTGKIEFTGNGFDSWSGLRYGLWHHDSAGTVILDSSQATLPDSTRWTGREDNARGYLFAPISGNARGTDGAWGVGTHGVNTNGNWLSTNGANARVYGESRQKPARAVSTAGSYEFAISIQPLANGTKEVRYYLIKGTAAQSEQSTYYFGGSFIDTTNMAPTFNGIVFGAHATGSGENTTLRGMNVVDVKVALGSPITVPTPPWSDYYVDQWGFFGWRGDGVGGHRNVIGNWRFVPDPNNVIGNAGIATDAASTIEWAVIRGGFVEPVTATTAKALTVTGKIEFTGNGFDSWSGLRYGLWHHDSAGTVILDSSQATLPDSTRWTGREDNARGYLFAPISGNARGTDGAWGVGTHGVNTNGNWLSTNGANARVYGESRQKPARAVSTAGSYEFAISIQPLANGTKEVRYYLIKGTAAQSEQSTYYFGGSFIDTTNMAPTFNGIVFGAHATGSGENTTLRGMNVVDVKVALGSPITVPTPPWQDYYVDQWGFFGWRGDGVGGHRNVIGNWRFVPDPNNVIGNAGIATDAASTIEWAVIRGGFVEPVTATTAKALTVTGKIEFTGNGFDSWSGLRYGLWHHDSAGTVILDSSQATLPDSTRWTGREDNARGYLFAPISGNARGTDGAWGVGTHGVNTNGNWLSTNGANARVYGESRQKPARAVSTAGSYEFAISIQPLANGTKEVRYYLIKGTAAQSEQSTYYFGGSFIDTTNMAPTFNGIVFGAHATGSGENTTLRGMNVVDVKVALGSPITVPTPPWSDYYVDQWGFFGWRGDGVGGHRNVIGNWRFVPDPNNVIGNAGIATDAASTIEWAVIRGGFVEPVTATTAKALTVTGKIEFTGNGFDSWSGLRYGLWHHDSAGTVILDSSQATLPDSTRWTGREDNARGYLFAPISGNARGTDGAWGVGTHGVNTNGNWLSTNGANARVYGESRQKPARAVSTAGSYEFAISIQPLANGTKEVRYYLIKGTAAQSEQSTYYFGGSFIDTTNMAPTFNGIVFGAHATGSGENTTLRGMNVVDVKVALGSPITVPTPPWQDYYVDQWGFSGNKFGGWSFVPDPNGVIGNAGVAGSSPNSGITALRGGFVDPVMPTGSTKSLVVTGKVELVGGGFETANSLRFGLFYSDSAGSVVVKVDTVSGVVIDSTRWNGTDSKHSGYLFAPPSGANASLSWNGTPSSTGGILNGVWSAPDANSYPRFNYRQAPVNAVGGAGAYDFVVSIFPKGNDTNDVRFKLMKIGGGYTVQGQIFDNNANRAKQFNSIGFALVNGNTTTALNLIDVKVALTNAPIVTSVPEAKGGIIPTVYALEQNYPNPFNPSTTIQYDVPNNAHVQIGIYDILGRLVTTLVNGNQEPNRYTVQWNASNFGSGVYFYKIDARNEDGSGTFTSVKKLLLVK